MPLRIIRKDLLKMKVEAIVNPTDKDLSGLSGLDLRIHKAGKDELKEELATIEECHVGDAIMTFAYNLRCSFIIHTVVPTLNDPEEAFKVIESCYRNCLELADDNKIESIAFPLLSPSEFNLPNDKLIRIAINTINAFLKENEMNVYLVSSNSETFGISKKLIKEVESYLDDEGEDDKGELFRKLLSCYEFNDTPLDNNPLGETKVSDIISDSFGYGESICYEMTRILVKEDFDALLPELDKIKGTLEDSFTYKLFKIIDDNGLKDSDVYNAAGISKMVFSNLRKGVIPKKKTVFQLCIALPINIEQATDLLASAGYTFVLSDKFEKTIKKILEIKNTSALTRIDVIDIMLYNLKLPVFNRAY